MAHSCEYCGKFVSLSDIKDDFIVCSYSYWEHSGEYKEYAHSRCLNNKAKEWNQKYSGEINSLKEKIEKLRMLEGK